MKRATNVSGREFSNRIYLNIYSYIHTQRGTSLIVPLHSVLFCFVIFCSFVRLSRFIWWLLVGASSPFRQPILWNAGGGDGEGGDWCTGHTRMCACLCVTAVSGCATNVSYKHVPASAFIHRGYINTFIDFIPSSFWLYSSLLLFILLLLLPFYSRSNSHRIPLWFCANEARLFLLFKFLRCSVHVLYADQET